ncbi:hypothetical protein C8R43DRAFT_265727 [Mycena crocata]|nr:hypothetical protein C8R43DRAFT_265727 [Mycena crocata]
MATRRAMRRAWRRMRWWIRLPTWSTCLVVIRLYVPAHRVLLAKDDRRQGEEVAKSCDCGRRESHIRLKWEFEDLYKREFNQNKTL